VIAEDKAALTAGKTAGGIKDTVAEVIRQSSQRPKQRWRGCQDRVDGTPRVPSSATIRVRMLRIAHEDE